jgi:hypothetical protein
MLIDTHAYRLHAQRYTRVQVKCSQAHAYRLHRQRHTRMQITCRTCAQDAQCPRTMSQIVGQDAQRRRTRRTVYESDALYRGRTMSLAKVARQACCLPLSPPIPPRSIPPRSFATNRVEMKLTTPPDRVYAQARVICSFSPSARSPTQ